MEKNIPILLSILWGLITLGALSFLSSLFRPAFKKKQNELGDGIAQKGVSLSYQKLTILTLVFFQAILFLIATASVFKSQLGSGGSPKHFMLMMVFLGLITVGLFFLWVKGDLSLVKGREK